MDTPYECRAIDFDDRYFAMYGQYPWDDIDGEDGEPLDVDQKQEIQRDRTRAVRKSLGWE